jgi:hypothetical protein
VYSAASRRTPFAVVLLRSWSLWRHGLMSYVWIPTGRSGIVCRSAYSQCYWGLRSWRGVKLIVHISRVRMCGALRPLSLYVLRTYISICLCCLCVCDTSGSLHDENWKQVLMPYLLERCRRFGGTYFLCSVMRITSYPGGSCSLYMCVQGDYKVSIHGENSLFIYKTCSVWALLLCWHIQMCLSHSWRTRWCYPRTSICNAFF